MKRQTGIGIFAALALGTATAASAQSDPRLNSYNWKYDNRLSVPAKVYLYFPTKCFPAISRAFSTYNAARSRLVFTYSGGTTDQVGQGTSNNSDLIIATGALTDPTALAEAPPQRSSRSTSWSYGPGFLVSDVDIIFNANKMFYQPSSTNSVGDFFCPSASGQTTENGKADFETTLLHEITHANGLAHFSQYGCVMYAPQFTGQTGQQRTYCSAERTLLQQQYGTR